MTCKNILLITVLVAFCNYAFATNVKLSVSGSTYCLVSTGTGKKTIKVLVENADDSLEINGKIYQYNNNKLIDESPVVLGKDSVTIKFDIKNIGFYNFTVIAKKSGNEIARVDSTYAVIPHGKFIPPAEMGTCTHFAQGKGAYPLTFDLLKLAGFTRIRDDFPWNSIEKKANEYTIPQNIEKLVNTAHQYKIKPLLVTGYNNDKVYPGKFTKGFVTTPEMRQAYGSAVAYAVKYFGNKVTEWELWNEPNAADPIIDYLPMLKKLYPKIKKANPQATVVSCGGGGAGGGVGGGFIVPIINSGGVNYQDGFSIHPYTAPFDPDYGYAGHNSPISRASILCYTSYFDNLIHSNLNDNAKPLSLWITELGWPVDKQITPLIQAAYFSRMYLLFRKANVASGVFWYDFQDDGTDPNNKEHNFGIIKNDYSPKPSYQAAAIVARVLSNLRYMKRLKTSDKTGNCEVNYYAKGNKHLVAVWTAQKDVQAAPEETVYFKLPFKATQARLIDWQGQPQELVIRNNIVKIKATYLPKYVISK